jgi:hypothetical protein
MLPTSAALRSSPTAVVQRAKLSSAVLLTPPPEVVHALGDSECLHDPVEDRGWKEAREKHQADRPR